MNIRSRNDGRSFELRITHRLLDKPVYRTCTTRLEAEHIGGQALRALDAGQIPVWLHPQDSKPLQTIAQAVQGYLAIQEVKDSTERVLDTLTKSIGSTSLSDVNYAWAEAWIQSLKSVEHHNAPGTIRKKKSNLSAVFAWVVRTHPVCLPHNPLVDLPHRFATYDRRSRELLLDAGLDVPEDEERQQRIDPHQEAAICQVLQTQIADAHTDRDRAEAEGLLLMFKLCIQTAMCYQLPP